MQLYWKEIAFFVHKTGREKKEKVGLNPETVS